MSALREAEREAERERERADELDRANDRLLEEKAGLVKERDQLAAMLAWACEKLEDYETLREDVRGWYSVRRETEERRKAEVRKAALAKLTPEERELLGVRG